jgi:HAD superfamily hydrolase (TIGR01509 family)
MPANRVVIFDLDNTLVINKPAAKAAYEAAIRFLAKETKLDFDKLFNHWKRLVQQLTTETTPEKRAFEYSLSVLTTEHRFSEKLIPPTIRIYEKELLAALKPMAGAKEIVSWIKEIGGLVAVAAGTDRSLAKKKLKATDLLKFVDLIITSADVGHMKPHPAYYTQILDKLKVSKPNAIVISDSKKEDIGPASKLGIKTIEVNPNQPHLTQLKPELSEFLSFAK